MGLGKALSTQASPATATAAALEGIYATQAAKTEAPITARATASAFPTAVPPRVVQGWPAIVTGRRDGLSLTVRLSKDTFLFGEGGMAEVEVRNDGPETVFINGSGVGLASLALLDPLGQQPDAWPISFSSRIRGGPIYLQKLAPGGVLSKTIQFQIPTAMPSSPSHDLSLWAETRFSRPQPGNADGPDNLWMRLEAGPVKLSLSLPDRAHHLNVGWRVDHNGWQLKVTTGVGTVPPNPIWGEIALATSNMLGVGPLPKEQTRPGAWESSWSQSSFPSIPDNVQEIAGGWVAAEGYVTAIFLRMLPGQGDARQMFGLSYEGPKREDYLSVQAAQVTVSFPIVPLAPAVEGSALKNVHVERCCGDTPTQITVQQQVQSSDGSWILLSQRPPSADSSSIQWGVARYDWEAQQVDLGGRTAYVLQRFGWWYVDWEINRMSFELQAPATLGQPDLLRIALKIIAQ